jgi:hypothetical protein
MPTVDFSLEDVRKLINSEVPPIIERLIDEKVPTIINERVPTIINELVPDLFVNFYDTNLGPVFESVDDQFDGLRDSLEEIKADIKGIKRIVRKHSSGTEGPDML